MNRREYITVIDGIEGSGKTTVMTYENIKFVKRGGKLYTFPGYDVFDDNHRKVSQQLALEELVELFVTGKLENARLSIDEMENWLDSYESQSQIGKILVSIAQQRRKRNLSMIGTINPDWQWLPKRYKAIAQILMHCEDMYFVLHGAVPEGELFRITEYDLKGMKTGKLGRRLRPRNFPGKALRPYFDSFGTVDIIEKYTKVRVKKREIEVDFNGNQIEGETQIDKWAWLDSKVNEIKERNIDKLQKWQLLSLLEKPITKDITEMLNIRGIHWDHYEQAYVIDSFELPPLPV